MKTGRKAVILSIAMQWRPIDELLTILGEHAQKDCDLILLPETCLGNELIIQMDGEEIRQISAIAEKYSKYIVFPVYRSTPQAERVNSALLFNRKGELVGAYDKVYPYWEEYNLIPPVATGKEVCVFQTDFGRIGIAICFDVNFTEIWRFFRQEGVELVLWPSAYSGGRSLQAHAINYNYYIISSTQKSDCHVYDITGQETFYGKSGNIGVFRNEVDLDRCIFHQDFNITLRDRLLKEHFDEIEMDVWHEKEGWFTLCAQKEGVSARALAKSFGIEELPAYKKRSEHEIDLIRGVSLRGG